MNTNYRVRRATIDDLKALAALWQSMNFPAVDLEKRITEFQVAVSSEGKLLGSVGLEVAGREGLIQYEAFNDFSIADSLRPLLWERIQNIATNRGLFRLWTQEHAPFWTRSGLGNADARTLEKLPVAWRKDNARWLTLQLRDDAAIEAISLDKEFAMFMEAEKQKTAEVFQRAKTVKLVATAFLLVIALIGFVAAFFVFIARRNPDLLRGGH